MVSPLKIIFAGSPEFAVPTLNALINSHHEVIAVYTQPDKPAGRGQHIKESAVKKIALKNNIPIFQLSSLRDEIEQKKLKHLNPDLMVVVAYGLLLPSEILTTPKYGCLNVHASLLPRWRGAAPIQRAIEAGDTKTGVTIMQMDEGLDTGAILKKVSYHIKNDDTSQTLFDTLSKIGADALLETIDEIISNKLSPVKQDDSQATYAKKIEKQEAKINWHKSAKEIGCLIRAFIPWPVAFTMLNNEIVRIWDAEVLEKTIDAAPGTIIQASKDGLQVATGNGVINIKVLQFPGKKPLPVIDILNAKKADLIPNNNCFST